MSDSSAPGSRPMRKRHAAARSSSDGLFSALPDELLGDVALWLPGRDLASMLLAHKRWRSLVLQAAQTKLSSLDPGCQYSTCWPLALASFEALASTVGTRPQHDWVEEWPRLARIRQKEAGAAGRIESLLIKNAMAAELRHGLGYPFVDACAVAVLCTFFRGAFASYLRNESPDEAEATPASHWMLRDALLAAAQRQQNPSQPCYAVLRGTKSSLCASDSSWNILNDLLCGDPGSDSSPPAPFCAHGAAVAVGSRECPGWKAGLIRVCFESLPANRSGHRSLIDVGSGHFVLPPLAWVTVTRVVADEQAQGHDEGASVCVHVRVRYA